MNGYMDWLNTSERVENGRAMYMSWKMMNAIGSTPTLQWGITARSLDRRVGMEERGKEKASISWRLPLRYVRRIGFANEAFSVSQVFSVIHFVFLSSLNAPN